MTTIAVSPSPNKTYKIVAVTTQRYGPQYESVIEYADGLTRVVERMRDWAGWHGAIDRLSQDGLFFDKVDDGGNVVTFRVEVVEAEPLEPANDDAVEIDGRAYQVTDRLTVEQLPARAASIWQKRGIVARVEVRRPRGRAAYLADLHADGSYSRPWRGALLAN